MTATTINLTLIPQTNQEAFDMVVAHLRAAPRRACVNFTNESGLMDGMCVYRGDGNPSSHIRCAIGCLISDDHYTCDLEGKGVHAFWALNGRWGINLTTTISHSLLQKLQNAHDAAENWDDNGFDNEDALVSIAFSHQLVYPLPPTPLTPS